MREQILLFSESLLKASGFVYAQQAGHRLALAWKLCLLWLTEFI
jgi:hypothetical protein